MSKILRYAVVQRGYCVFGAGHTKADAYQDAALSLDGGDDAPVMTPERVAGMIETNPYERNVDGKLILIDSTDPYFDDYMRAQGWFEKTMDGWIEKN